MITWSCDDCGASGAVEASDLLEMMEAIPKRCPRCNAPFAEFTSFSSAMNTQIGSPRNKVFSLLDLIRQRFYFILSFLKDKHKC